MLSRIDAARIAEGDPLPPETEVAAWPPALVDELYRTERPKLLRLLSRQTCSETAQDVVQQVFARLAALDDQQARAIRSPAAYVREAVRNVLRDNARAAGRQRLHLHISTDEVAVAGPDPVAALEARDRLARLEQAMLRLKPFTRQIFLAHRLDGYSYAEIAERTGLSEKGVEKQMSRAIKQLGRHLRRHD
jgi:RNA polymerase sigma-70 factor (ECF subfamily)